MKTSDIDNVLKKHLEKKNITTASRQFGVMGICLGKELHIRLRNFANKNNIAMAVIIKTLLTTYLDEKEKGDK